MVEEVKRGVFSRIFGFLKRFFSLFIPSRGEKEISTVKSAEQPEIKKESFVFVKSTSSHEKKATEESSSEEEKEEGEKESEEKLKEKSIEELKEELKKRFAEGELSIKEYVKELEALEELKKLREKSIGEKPLKEALGEKVRGYGKEIATAPKKSILEGFDKLFGGLRTRGAVAKSYLGEWIKFSVLLPIAFSLFLFVILAEIQWWTGVSIPDLLIETIPFFGKILANWFTMGFVWSTFVVFTVAVFTVLLPFSIVIGRRWNISGANTVCLMTIATAIGLYGFDHALIPVAEAYFPEETAMIKCMIKYHGDMAICAFGEEEIKVEKEENNYETLALELGLKSPSGTVIPKPSAGQPYDLIFRLINKNSVGSGYIIKVKNLEVNVTDGETLPADYITPNVSSEPLEIRPGWPETIQAHWDSMPSCENYFYFNIRVESEQTGGGSSKFGVVDQQEGNENFIYFFDPEVGTKTGPLDIYVYTVPFVLVKDKLHGNEFLIYIFIENKKDGVARIDNLKIIQNPVTEQERVINLTECTVCSEEYITCSSFQWDGTLDLVSNCGIAPENLKVEKEGKDGSVLEIRCKGEIIPDRITGKGTQWISVEANYTYIQTFKEQIGAKSCELPQTT